MDERRVGDELDAIEGADSGALGIGPAPESAPPGAEVSPEEHLVPGADFETRPHTEAKPWFTSLAAESEQAGVANEPPDTIDPLYPEDEVNRGR